MTTFWSHTWPHTLLALCVACGPADTTMFVGDVPDIDWGAAPATVEPVRIGLAPASPGARAGLLGAIARWEAAGVAPGQLVLSPSGVPAALVPDCIPWPADNTCRHGALDNQGIRVWVDSPDPHRTWTHELGHVMNLPHMADGIMSASGGITAGTLEAVCTMVLCNEWKPEL